MRRLGKCIIGARKVVEPNALIPEIIEHSPRQFGLIEALVCAWQRGCVDETLTALEPGHVRIAKERNPLGPQFGGEPDRTRKVAR